MRFSNRVQFPMLAAILPLLAAFRFISQAPDVEQVSCRMSPGLIADSTKALSEVIPNDWMNQLRMRFTENRGQIVDNDGDLRPDILYTASACGARLYLTKTGVSTVFMQQQQPEKPVSEATGAEYSEGALTESAPMLLHRVTMTLVGCNPDAVVTHGGEFPGYENFYLAHCPEGITGVPSWRRIEYSCIYDHINMVYRSAGPREFKYDFVVNPGGDPSGIRMRFEGAGEVGIDSRGDLHVVTSLGEQLHRAPFAYTGDGDAVRCSYRIKDNEVGFMLGEYDRAETLVIDPWGMHLGGAASDQINSIDIDGNGDIAVTGNTMSANFPVLNGAQQTLQGSTDLLIAKFSNSGTMQWSTYLGGGDLEYGRDLDFDGTGDLYIIGETRSQNFPVSSAYQGSSGGGADFAIAKLSGSGALSWATYLGGSGNDEPYGIHADGLGGIAITGRTSGSNFPVYNAVQPAMSGGSDCIVGRMSTGGQLLWATFHGGSSNEYGSGVATDAVGNIYCAGFTFSSNFPVFRAHQSAFGGIEDFIVSKWTQSGSLIWATFLGGSTGEEATGVCVGPLGSCTVVGRGGGSPVVAGMIARFDSSGSLQTTRYLAGGGNDDVKAVAADAQGNIAVVGTTSSSSFPVTNAFQSYLAGSSDAFVGVMNYSSSAGYQTTWLSYFGTAAFDGGHAVAIQPGTYVYFGGRTDGNFYTAFPSFTNANAGSRDGFLVQFNFNGYYPVEFSALSAELSRNHVSLYWTCASENNNRGFEVQRSMTSRDGDWECRGFVEGAGTSSSAREYMFNDDIPAGLRPGESVYYRLKQIDFDGSFRYSPVVTAFPSPESSGLYLSPPYPQPASRKAAVRFALHADGVVSLTLHDAAGRTVAKWLPGKFLRAGEHCIDFDWNEIPPGVYFLRLNSTGASAVQRLAIR